MESKSSLFSAVSADSSSASSPSPSLNEPRQSERISSGGCCMISFLANSGLNILRTKGERLPPKTPLRARYCLIPRFLKCRLGQMYANGSSVSQIELTYEKIYKLFSDIPSTRTFLRFLRVVDLEVPYPHLPSSNANADGFP